MKRPHINRRSSATYKAGSHAWATLYATESRPFNAPKGKSGKPGKIAVKVINHYGDEVLKVYEVK